MEEASAGLLACFRQMKIADFDRQQPEQEE
jgi:hypothetical protein